MHLILVMSFVLEEFYELYIVQKDLHVLNLHILVLTARELVKNEYELLNTSTNCIPKLQSLAFRTKLYGGKKSD